jgi:hypothetical protein
MINLIALGIPHTLSTILPARAVTGKLSLLERERIMRRTIQQRSLMYQQNAA